MSKLDLKALSRSVIRVRTAQLLVNDLNRAATFRIPVHLALGHEGVAVAVAEAMRPGDRLLLTHRNIHYNLACGTAPDREVAEYMLRPDGVAGGTRGAMNLNNPDIGLIYTSSILANNLCVAIGVAVGARMDADRSVAVAVTGDGALEEGAFYEALVCARAFEAPLMILVENNGWSMYTRIDERRKPIDLRAMAEALGAAYVRLDGSDPVAAAEGVSEAVSALRAGGPPAIVEATVHTLGETERFDEKLGRSRIINYHHGVAPVPVAPEGPVISATAKDPLWRMRERIGEAAFDAMAGEIRAELAREIGRVAP